MDRDRVKKLLLNKYTIVILLFLVIIIFFDNYNLIDRWKNNREIKKLEKEIGYYKKEIEKNRDKVEQLKLDGKDELEKYGREKFKLKKDGEEIFIVKEEEEK